eukprot:TRINITY_DN1717_c0_g1_i1.p1 TRINITY_DN1717_c0_g1~~TRINITY_DN1717_c0_g1_i1.p1  ORF type:complete len:352 (-),score=93.33 TRINITY_DN1717_c0_g1_i1:25-1080(-)
MIPRAGLIAKTSCNLTLLHPSSLSILSPCLSSKACSITHTTSSSSSSHGGRANIITRSYFKNAGKRPMQHTVFPGKISTKRQVPNHIEYPPYAIHGTTSNIEPFGLIPIKNQAEIEGVREACRLARKILDYSGVLVQPGVTTDKIDQMIHNAIIEEGAYPSPLNYGKFPKSICTSVNEVMVHGIPDDRPLLDGDIVTVDITVFYKGFHGDCCATFLVGESVDEKARKLVKVAKQCRDAGISVIRPGIAIAAIGAAIQTVAEHNKFAVVPDLVGHGIGRIFHDNPFIFHTRNDFPGTLEPGMIFTVEPVIVEKKTEHIQWDDDWTITTKDGGWAAQFEHTVVVTRDGCEILT